MIPEVCNCANPKMIFTVLTGLVVDCGDYVTVTNAKRIAVTGRKAEQKVYRHHTMWPGGLKEISFETMLERKPDEVRRLKYLVHTN